MIHTLKTWPEPFDAISRGLKTYEIRRNDRDFKVGDVLILHEWDPSIKAYSRRLAVRSVTYMTQGGEWGLPDNLCVLGLRPIDHAPACEDEP